MTQVDVAAETGRPTSATIDDGRTALGRVADIATRWTEQRRDRQRRRELDAADFQQLEEAGFLRCAVPADQGGYWQGTTGSVRIVGELLRAIARADSSVALVAAMHPSVLAFWLASPEAPGPYTAAWRDQRQQLFETARAGAWWGTITSEPGSGGDLRQSRSVARHDPAGDSAYRLFGDKHFGSGSGVTSYMMTVALPEGEADPDLFILNVRDASWNGSTGMRLVAPWDGHGMIATQSHAFHFEGYPATRSAWPGSLVDLGAAAQPFIRCCFTAVIVGIVDVAIATAHEHLAKRHDTLGPYERVEWTRVEMEGWLVQQAYAGMLRAVETGESAGRATLQGKLAVAELAESVMSRLCRIVGGGTYARSSPFGAWAQDVRALGFLRPPWPLAFGTLMESAWDVPAVPQSSPTTT